MFAVPAYFRSGMVYRFPSQRSLAVASLVLLVGLSARTLRAENWVQANQELARAWAMQGVAVIQAEAGEDLAAKRTAWEIGENDVIASDVVAVCCMNGQIFYDHPPGYCLAPPSLGSYGAGWVGQDSRGNPYWANHGRVGDRVPAQDLHKNNTATWSPLPSPPAPLPKGERSNSRTGPKSPPDLRPDYLDPDPQHGAVVDFSEDYDSHGTRLTSRRYSDGCVVVESLRRPK